MTLDNKKKFDRLIGGLLLIIATPIFKKIAKKSGKIEDKTEVLIIKLVGGGSLVNFLPTLVSLKKSSINYKLNILCTKKVEPFAKSLGVFDAIYSLNDSSLFTLFISYLLFFLKFKKIQTVIDLEVHSRVTSLLTMFSFSNVRIGFFVESVMWRKDIYTHLIFYNRFANRGLILNKVSDLYGLKMANQDDCKSQIVENEFSHEEAKNYCVFAPCSSELAKTERQLEVTQWGKFLQKNLKIINFEKVILLATKEDLYYCESLKALLSKVFPQLEIINLAGKTSFKEAITITQNAKFFIGIDSSLIHFAHLFAKTGLGIWGPTSPNTVLNTFWSSPLKSFYIPVGCSPCIHIAEEPPCKGNNMCIKIHFEAHDNLDKNFIPIIKSK